ncbi:hypothetical protein ACW14Y_30690 [Kitasatospora sp. cg17-2]
MTDREIESRMEMSHALTGWAEWASRAYGDGPRPNFAFVNECYDRNPYAEQIRRMSEIAGVEECTNLDDDVCFRLEVDGGRRRKWIVLLSMVGPFAMVIQVDKVGSFFSDLVSTPLVASTDQVAAALLEILRDGGFHVLSAEESTTNAPFMIPPDEEPEDGPLYRILFSDATELPW